MWGLYLSTVVLGCAAGWGMEKAAGMMIRKRQRGFGPNRLTGSFFKTLVWMLTNAAIWLLLVGIGGLNGITVEYGLIASACIILSAVDFETRKIPNEIILFLLVVGISFIFLNGRTDSFRLNFLGFAAGFFIFLMPSKIGRSGGMGDVKYAAVAGLCLGVYGLLISLVIMSLGLFCYLGYLLYTGKGNLKTKVAMGPFMATGVLTVMLFNIANTRWGILDLSIIQLL